MADARELLKQFPPELRTSVQQVQAFSGGGFRNANVQFMTVMATNMPFVGRG